MANKINFQKVNIKKSKIELSWALSQRSTRPHSCWLASPPNVAASTTYCVPFLPLSLHRLSGLSFNSACVLFCFIATSMDICLSDSSNHVFRSP